LAGLEVWKPLLNQAQFMNLFFLKCGAESTSLSFVNRHFESSSFCHYSEFLNHLSGQRISGIDKWVLPGISNRDWEDIAIGPGPIPGESYIYVGDIGDNRSVRGFVNIYRFVEPQLTINPNQQEPFKMTITNVETIRVEYPDGPRDAETLMIDPATKDLIIITKREVQVHVYQLPFPHNTSGAATNIHYRGKLPFRMVTAGDISPDGQEIGIKDLGAIYHWNATSSGIIETMFKQTPTRPEYIPEVQGEALGWSHDGSGYFTITEIENHQVEALLRYYSR
jgi:hypothetical protein